MADTLLANKSILVVGAAGLLGTSVVSGLLQHSARIIAADVNLERLRTCFAAKEFEAYQNRLTLVELDITSEAAVKTFFACEKLSLDGAVNATYPRNSLYGAHFFDVSMDSFNQNVALHLGSAFLLMQQAAAYFMRQQCPFSLVNISSIYGVVAPKFNIYEGTSMTVPVEYAAIKSSIIHLTKYVSSYVRDSQFRVNSVSPGGIADNQPQSFVDLYKANSRGTGMLGSDDILGAVAFLLSDSSQYVTAQNLIVDDGFHL